MTEQTPATAAARRCYSISPRNLGLVQCQREHDHDGRHEATNRDNDHVSWTGENQ